jgi:hypothetical protein
MLASGVFNLSSILAFAISKCEIPVGTHTMVCHPHDLKVGKSCSTTMTTSTISVHYYFCYICTRVARLPCSPAIYPFRAGAIICGSLPLRIVDCNWHVVQTTFSCSCGACTLTSGICDANLVPVLPPHCLFSRGGTPIFQRYFLSLQDISV